ncbi:MAG: ABC transporter permease [Anaerolineae bacterium]|nr:ABC transporter permease [Anaerolineae bacterium]
MRILDLALKDLYQIIRDWKGAIFLLAMPIAFTLLLGFVFAGVDEGGDARLPIAVLDADGSPLSQELIALFDASSVIAPGWVAETSAADLTELERQVVDGNVVAAVVIPAGYSDALRGESNAPLQLIADTASGTGSVVESEIQRLQTRLRSAVAAARLSVEALVAADPATYGSETAQTAVFDESLAAALVAWDTPSITLAETGTGQEQEAQEEESSGFSHTSAGIMVQFAIAGLIGATEVIVVERKSRTLQRMLTTTLSKAGIIAGHYLAMFVMVFAQLFVLILFGQLALKVPYFREPVATLIMVIALSLFTASLGLLISAISKTEEHTIIWSMVLMMVLSGMGGAWMPLETTSETFQTLGHFLPTAWAVDGMKNITVRMLGVNSVLMPAGILLGFAVACLVAGVVLFRTE